LPVKARLASVIFSTLAVEGSAAVDFFKVVAINLIRSRKFAVSRFVAFAGLGVGATFPHFYIGDLA
jgi:hypothetical protein